MEIRSYGAVQKTIRHAKINVYTTISEVVIIFWPTKQREMIAHKQIVISHIS